MVLWFWAAMSITGRRLLGEEFGLPELYGEVAGVGRHWSLRLPGLGLG